MLSFVEAITWFVTPDKLSSVTDNTSFTEVGVSFTDVIVIATVSVSLKGVPSLSVETIVNVSEPLKSWFGV